MPEGTYHHLALARDWEEAQAGGWYTTSTAGASLDEVGYIHMSRPDQVAGVAERFYAGVEGVLLLDIDASRLDSPVRDDRVGTTTFPHLYGPLPVSAVTRVRPYPT